MSTDSRQPNGARRLASAAYRLLVATGALLLVATAALPGRAQATEVFGGLGTSGVEIGVAERVGGIAGLRLGAEFLKVSRDFESDGATYDTKLKFSTLGVYGDYFVAGGGFRLSAGAVIGMRKASGNAVATNGSISINGTPYSATGESVGAEAKFPSVAPYLGIGYGHHQPRKGSGFYLDLGVVIGKADAQLSPSAGLAAAAGPANVAAEQQKLQDSVNKLKAYPVLKFGFSYAF
jgi:hypothetical protein